MNLRELASGPIIPASPTYLRDKFCLRGRKKKIKKRKREGGGGSLLFSFLVEINFSQGDKAIFIAREGNKAIR